MANILNYKGENISTVGSRFKRDRLFLLDDSVADSLNKYNTWGEFSAFSMPIFEADKNEELPTSNMSIKSLFSPVNSVGSNRYIQVRANAPLLDDRETRSFMRMFEDCSIKSLVEASKKNMLGRAVYSYADFMYCKHLGKVSNNHLITLRRFATPCGDHINFTNPLDPTHDAGNDTEKHVPDIGRMVTWMGTPGNEMPNILKYTVKMPWKPLDSKMEDAQGGGEDGGPLGTFLNATTSTSYQDAMRQGYAGTSAFNYLSGIMAPFGMGGLFSSADPPYKDLIGFRDANKVYGPIDVIAKTHIRDIGLEFEQDITLTFDYELRSYNGINGKAAFLDLLANILSVTYATGPFWGGAYRFTGMSQSNVFANLPIFHMQPGSSASDYLDSALDSGKVILGSLTGGKGFDKNNPLGSVMDILSTIGKGLFSAFLGAGMNKMGRPHKQGLNSLLSPAPVGYWHLTVGNPWHPILMMGNLIIDNCEIEHYGPLGLDDFPTGLKVVVKLKHAKPRDAALIESMYMFGENRIYTPAGDDVMKMYTGAKNTKNRYSKNRDGRDRHNRRNSSDGLSENTKNNMQDFLSAVASGDWKSVGNTLKSGAGKMWDATKKAASAFGEYTENAVENFQTPDSMYSLMSEIDACGDVLIEHFGTDKQDVVIHTAKESAFGSRKKPPKEEKK